MRTLLISSFVLLLVSACGGGGGGGPLNQGPVLTDEEVIQQVLETCGLEQLAAIQDALDVFRQFTDPNAPAPDLTLTGSPLATLPSGFVEFDLDLGDGGDPEFSGSLQVRDDLGAPLNLAPIVLAVGSTDPLDILAALPDGTQVEIAFAGKTEPTSPDFDGLVSTVFMSGAPESATGSVTAVRPDCAVTLGFTDLPIDQLNAAVPTATFDVTFLTPTETITGPAVFDGTDVVMMTLSRNGGPSFVYLWNTTTDDLTLVP